MRGLKFGGARNVHSGGMDVAIRTDVIADDSNEISQSIRMRRPPNIGISHLAPSMRGIYVLSALARIWERKGHRVHVGLTYEADANVCLLHHDRTKLDSSLLPSPPPGVRQINGKILDISKRTYSSLSLSPADDWPGPVIIKTNLNHFGLPENSAKRAGIISRARGRLARLSWRAARMLPERYYPVLDSLKDVPDWAWRDPAYLVERFVPERSDDGLYCVRGWVFLGDKGYVYRIFSSHPLVKAGTMVRHEPLEGPPRELLQLREKMGFDYGKFDYVEHDGKPILLDANKTPTYSGVGETPRLVALAEGIESFL